MQAMEANVKRAQTVDELEQEMLGPRGGSVAEPEYEEAEEFIPKERKPLGKAMLALLISVAWLTLLSVAVLFVMFDPTPDKIVKTWVFMRLDPEEEILERHIENEIFELQDEWRSIDEEREELRVFEEELGLREEELDDWEDELNDFEMLLEDRRDMLIDIGAGATTSDILLAAKTLQKMDPAEAARVLEEMESESALRMCILISAKRLAPIMDVMEPEARIELYEALSEEADEDDWDDWDEDDDDDY